MRLISWTLQSGSEQVCLMVIGRLETCTVLVLDTVMCTYYLCT
jgi:hypothetical protein